MRDAITVEVNGKRYVGHREIHRDSARVLSQTVYYAERSKPDGRAYPPEGRCRMDAFAKVLVSELVREVEGQ